MSKWKENKQEQLTYKHLLDFAKGLSTSQGFYGRAYEAMPKMTDEEIVGLDTRLKSLGLKNDLMTIIELFEG